jgi:hypothetical protein
MPRYKEECVRWKWEGGTTQTGLERAVASPLGRTSLLPVIPVHTNRYTVVEYSVNKCTKLCHHRVRWWLDNRKRDERLNLNLQPPTQGSWRTSCLSRLKTPECLLRLHGRTSAVSFRSEVWCIHAGADVLVLLLVVVLQVDADVLEEPITPTSYQLERFIRVECDDYNQLQTAVFLRSWQSLSWPRDFSQLIKLECSLPRQGHTLSQLNVVYNLTPYFFELLSCAAQQLTRSERGKLRMV